MNTKQAKQLLTDLQITPEYATKRRSGLEFKVTDAPSLQAVSRNVKHLKDRGFFLRLYGQCDPSNLNPETPEDMSRCESCYLSTTVY